MLPRFTIAKLLAVVGLCGLAVASLRSPSYLWANAIYTAAAASVVAAAIQCVYGRGGRRAFWAGFLLAAGPYLMAYSVPSFGGAACFKLLTEPMLDMLYSLIASPRMTAGTTTVAASGSSMPGDEGLAFLTYPSTSKRSPAPPAPPLPSKWASWTEPDESQSIGHRLGKITLTSPDAFRQIGHSLMILLCGALGGAYARRVRERGQEESP
jgi:hypothetical protein